MNRCRNAEHPHCTVWVLPGESVCEHGHAQPAMEAAPVALPSSFEAISSLRSRPPTTVAQPVAPSLQRAQLHISGYDPRAAGGRQAIRLELRGMPMDCAPEVRMLVRSALRLQGGESHVFQRTSRGDWRPLFLEFSSRGLEHGQYRIDIELHSRHPQAPEAARTWTCSPVILVPRLDASLGEIHQTFLATHKNVRVVADDAGIARVQMPAGGRVDIDVAARNASIAQLNLSEPSGKVDLGYSTIAWDEDLIEIDLPAAAPPHPCPLASACIVHAEADSATQRHLRLFALDECVLGRFEAVEPEADLLLAHHGEAGADAGGLTRRISGRHAVIRRGRAGWEIEDVSRYGLLLDGHWPGKHAPVPLRLGMQIELTASIKGVVLLEVTALLPHALVLHRIDGGAQAECFYLMAPGTEGTAPGECAPRAAALPLLFHRDGGFWLLDRASGNETPLTPGHDLERVMVGAQRSRFSADAYPETVSARRKSRHGPGDRRGRNGAARFDA